VTTAHNIEHLRRPGTIGNNVIIDPSGIIRPTSDQHVITRRWRGTTGKENRSSQQTVMTRRTASNPAAIEAMRERGIDISAEFPKPWTDEIVRAADVIVTMGCGDACPIFLGKRYEDWVLDDPEGQDVTAVRPIPDEIEQRVRGRGHHWPASRTG
jgi:protein-tyrosine-phosphatase